MKQTTKRKAKTLFDHIRAITEKPYQADYWESLSENDKKTFQPYMINRFLSMNVDWLEIVNQFQPYTYQMNPREIYKLYASLLPKSKIFLKYIKASDEQKYPKELLRIFANHYDISENEARLYVMILSETNKRDEVERIVRLYGIEEKEVKKLIKF